MSRSRTGYVCAILATCLVALSSCDGRSNSDEYSPANVAWNGDDRGGEGSDATDLDDGSIRGGETYSQYDARRDSLDTGLYSGGDECTEDCAGHDAGRDWAEEKGITDPDDCGGRSWSFVEGCRSYAREQQGESSDDGEAD